MGMRPQQNVIRHQQNMMQPQQNMIQSHQNVIQPQQNLNNVQPQQNSFQTSHQQGVPVQLQNVMPHESEFGSQPFIMSQPSLPAQAQQGGVNFQVVTQQVQSVRYNYQPNQ